MTSPGSSPPAGVEAPPLPASTETWIGAGGNYVATWRITDPDARMNALRAEAQADLTQMTVDAGVVRTGPTRFDVVEFPDGHLELLASVPVEPAPWTGARSVL